MPRTSSHGENQAGLFSLHVRRNPHSKRFAVVADIWDGYEPLTVVMTRVKIFRSALHPFQSFRNRADKFDLSLGCCRSGRHHPEAEQAGRLTLTAAGQQF